jgi:hypothetical protein
MLGNGSLDRQRRKRPPGECGGSDRGRAALIGWDAALRAVYSKAAIVLGCNDMSATMSSRGEVLLVII